MLIIVEGIDRVGKTTLCEKLSNDLNVPIHKYKGLVNYKDMVNKEESDKTIGLLQLLKETNANIIFDRTYFSDYVYGLLERNYEVYEAADNFLEVDKIAAEIDNVFLILIEPVDIERSSKEHGKDLKKYNGIFKALFRESYIKNKFRCTYNTMNEAIIFIKSRLKGE